MANIAFDLDMEPHDRLLAAVVRQAIRDYEHGGAGHPGPTSLRATCGEYWAARCFLGQLGLLDDAGELVSPEVADVTLVWPSTA